MTQLRQIIERHGMNLSGFARAAGVDRSTATRWSKEKVPAERVVEIERRTGISRFELRPDLYALSSEGRAA